MIGIIRICNKEIKALEKEIKTFLDAIPESKERQQVLQQIDGIGEIISMSLIALLPELGRLNRREIANLVGLAPHPNESSQMVGYRCTKGGRQEVRSILFMAAMTVARSSSRLGEFYRELIARGKKRWWH
jgi:transposase